MGRAKDYMIVFGGKAIDQTTFDPLCLSDTWGLIQNSSGQWMWIEAYQNNLGPIGRYQH